MDTTTAIVPVDNEQNRYIELAQARAGENMFSIQDFVRVINYNIDPLFVDEQWNMLNAQRPEELILLTAPMLERLHFSRIANLIKKLQQLFPASCGRLHASSEIKQKFQSNNLLIESWCSFAQDFSGA